MDIDWFGLNTHVLWNGQLTPGSKLHVIIQICLLVYLYTGTPPWCETSHQPCKFVNNKHMWLVTIALIHTCKWRANKSCLLGIFWPGKSVIQHKAYWNTNTEVGHTWIPGPRTTDWASALMPLSVMFMQWQERWWKYSMPSPYGKEWYTFRRLLLKRHCLTNCQLLFSHCEEMLFSTWWVILKHWTSSKDCKSYDWLLTILVPFLSWLLPLTLINFSTSLEFVVTPSFQHCWCDVVDIVILLFGAMHDILV